MEELIEFATNQFQENHINRERWLIIYSGLYEICKTDFHKTCNYCYEVNSFDSYCNCKIKCKTICNDCYKKSNMFPRIEIKKCEVPESSITRKELIDFMSLYEKIETCPDFKTDRDQRDLNEYFKKFNSMLKSGFSAEEIVVLEQCRGFP